MKKLLTEPLLHFFILGAIIFAAYHLSGERAALQSAENNIVISAGKIENLAALFQRTWQRPPSQTELDGLIRDHLREEIFYREGIALGLDQDDTVIRRRIRQKMDFIVEDMAAQADPGDEALQNYLQQHAEQFRIAPQFSFQQIYLNPEQRGDTLMSDAQNLLASLQHADTASDAALISGDRIMLEANYQALSQPQVSRLFGEDFAAALAGLAAGEWQGPIASGYGMHLVKIEQRIDGRIPELAEVRASVLREWDNDRRNEAREEFYQSLLDRYNVVIEPLQTANGAAVLRTVEASQ